MSHLASSPTQTYVRYTRIIYKSRLYTNKSHHFCVLCLSDYVMLDKHFN